MGRWIAGWLVVMGVLCGAGVASAQDPEETVRAAERDLRSGQALQQAITADQERMATLQDEMQQLRLQLRWLEHQQARHRHYLEQERQALDAVQRQQWEARQLRLQLDPALDDFVADLERRIRDDLPFLPAERQARLSALRETLNRADAPVSERLRRLLEALQVEAGYGFDLTVTDAAIPLDNKQRYGRVLRIGRLVRYFLTTDGTLAAVQRGQGPWQLLPEGAAPVAQAMAMVQRQQPAGLVLLPTAEARP